MVVGVFGLAGKRALSFVELVAKVVLDHVTIQHLYTVVDSVLVTQAILKRVTTTGVQVLVLWIHIVDYQYINYIYRVYNI